MSARPGRKRKSPRKPAKRRVGRPLKIPTPAEFDSRVDAYVAECREQEQPITWTGVALALGLYGRDALDDYGAHEGFMPSVKRAKAIVENAYEKRLSAGNPAGAIFALKNMRWSDRQEIEHSGGVALRKLSDEELEAEIERLLSETGRSGKS